MLEASSRGQRARWQTYVENQFTGRHPLDVLQDGWTFHQPLYGQIMALVPPPARILEVGTGSGLNVAWLALRGYSVIGIDHSPQIITFARTLASRYDLPLTLEVGDAFDLAAYHDRADLVFSTGMLEHWDCDGLAHALREQAACAPLVVAQIPTKHTALTGRVTDETFYSFKALGSCFARAGLTPLRTFGYGAIPTRNGRALQRYMPEVALRRLRRRHEALSMAIGCVGRRTGP